MKNWNDGKAQEFKDRKVYDIGASTERVENPSNIRAFAEARSL